MGDPIHSGEIVVETRTYTLHQVCAICGIHSERVVELVSFGIVEPAGAQPESWQFSESAVHRALASDSRSRSGFSVSTG